MRTETLYVTVTLDTANQMLTNSLCRQMLVLNAALVRTSGIARISPLLGHTTFVRTSARSAEAYRGVWGHPPPENFTASQVGSEAIYRSEE